MQIHDQDPDDTEQLPGFVTFCKCIRKESAPIFSSALAVLTGGFLYFYQSISPHQSIIAFHKHRPIPYATMLIFSSQSICLGLRDVSLFS